MDEGLNNEEEMMRWLNHIRNAYISTKGSKYPYALKIGGILGRNKSKSRPLDDVLMDTDVAEYAKMIYAKKIAKGTFLSDTKKVKQFFSDPSKAADLIG